MNNVKASELRQGNIINVLYSSLARPSMEPRIMQAIVRGTDDKTVITDCAGVPNEDKCSGIPLTEDWLVKFGARKVNHIDGYIFWTFKGTNLNPCQIYIYENRIEYYGYPVCKNMTVHYLQNLYFTVRGEELKIKDL